MSSLSEESLCPRLSLQLGLGLREGQRAAAAGMGLQRSFREKQWRVERTWKGKEKCFAVGTGGVSKSHPMVMVRAEKKSKPREGLELQLEGARRGPSK